MTVEAEWCVYALRVSIQGMVSTYKHQELGTKLGE